MAEPHSSTMQRILDILTIANTGDRRRARDEFAALWNTLPARVGSDWLANAGPLTTLCIDCKARLRSAAR